MSTIKVVGFDARGQHGLALVAADDSVWVTTAPRWWNVLGWLRWWLAKDDRKAWVTLTTSGKRVRTRALRVARKHVKIGKVPGT